MDYQQKYMALRALAETTIVARAINDWSCSVFGVEEVEGHLLISRPILNAATPEAAICQRWDMYTKPGVILRCKNKNYSWNGFMWKEQEC